MLAKIQILVESLHRCMLQLIWNSENKNRYEILFFSYFFLCQLTWKSFFSIHKDFETSKHSFVFPWCCFLFHLFCCEQAVKLTLIFDRLVIFRRFPCISTHPTPAVDLHSHAIRCPLSIWFAKFLCFCIWTIPVRPWNWNFIWNSKCNVLNWHFVQSRIDVISVKTSFHWRILSNFLCHRQFCLIDALHETRSIFMKHPKWLCYRKRCYFIWCWW